MLCYWRKFEIPVLDNPYFLKAPKTPSLLNNPVPTVNFVKRIFFKRIKLRIMGSFLRIINEKV